MKTKSILNLLLLFLTTSLFSQIGIGTNNIQGVLHVDGSVNNDINQPLTQNLDDFIINSNGNIGVGTIESTNKLHIKSENNPIKLEGIENSNISTDNILTIGDDNIVKFSSLSKASIPIPAVLQLNQNLEEFLYNNRIGQSQSITNLKIIVNEIPGFTLDGSSVFLPKGTYQIVFTYEAEHNAPNCTISSYFMDFPTSDGLRRRIHTTAQHNQGTLSNHGGNIYFTLTLPVDYTWNIALGRGQSGNCDPTNHNNSEGMILYKNATQILFFRIGD